MSIKALELRIVRNELVVIVEWVPAWELPILEAMHQSVSLIGQSTFDDREPPDVQEEYKRLETRYGRTTNEDGSRGLPFVAAVYGQFNVGYSRLADAIKAAIVETPPADASDLLSAPVTVEGTKA
jgi:hypothetical protein